jgi:hypothetical protein
MKGLILIWIGLLLALGIGVGVAFSQDALDPSTVLPITLPHLGEPFVGPAILAGQSGFFWTRLGTEQAVEAMTEVPILQKEVNDEITAGNEATKKADEANMKASLFGIGCIILPILAVIVDEATYGTIHH